MYKVTITQTRTITIPCPEAKSQEHACALIATEFYDNGSVALCTPEDWETCETVIKAELYTPPAHANTL